MGAGGRGRGGRIRAGRLRKVVLARDLYASLPAPIDERLLLDRLAARYPDCYTFACDGLVGRHPGTADQAAGPADQLARAGGHGAARR